MKTLFFLLLFCITCVVPAFSQCLDDQKSLLLGLKNSLTFYPFASTKLVHWNHTKNCCNWDGVECDVFGHVISLQLDNETISGGIENSEYLFNLTYLEKLNLAFNIFNHTQIPKGISHLANLIHLNLSNAYFAGQVPSEVLRLKKLVSLDLSSFMLKLENPDLKMLARNLKGLKELYLDSVEISTQGNDWCLAISFLPDLRILSLRRCNLSGPIDSSLLELRSLSVLQLDGNNLASTVPGFLANFSGLTSLSMSFCSLLGSFPEKIFEVPSLQKLDLSFNPLLSGSFPNFLRQGSLRTIVLQNTNFSGSLPNFISNLTMLSKLNLYSCNFSGSIPPTIGNLTELTFLDFSVNNFTGSVPLFRLSKKLTYIDASFNSLTGSISSMHFEGLLHLEHIRLRYNLLSGNIPSSLFALPSLKQLDLFDNEFHGVQELTNKSASSLQTLDISSNHLEGPIPKFFFELEQLIEIYLSSNKFNGMVQLEMFENPSLEALDLSHNDLSILSINNDSSLPLLSNISVLSLASSKLQMLDLSSNQLKGEIPNWIWEIGNGSLKYLNLSHNLLHGFQKPYEFSSLSQQSSFDTLDFSSNQLKGEIPNWIWEIGNGSLTQLRLSHNLLNGFQKPYEFSSPLGQSTFVDLDLSSNQLKGEIPNWIWEIGNGSLTYLNLSHNLLNGFQKPYEFSSLPGQSTFVNLDLSSNQLKGEIPNWIWEIGNGSLTFLNLSHNLLDGFQKHYKFPSLAILDLHSNQLHGELPIPPLSCSYVDYSNNYFTNSIPNDIGIFLFGTHFFSASNNNLSGEIPPSICSATFFKVLDLSANALTGGIPHCLLNNSVLGILSLGRNNLNGTIPDTFSVNCSVGILDLNNNALEGKIPRSLVNCSFLEILNIGHNRFEDTFPCMLMSSHLRVLILQSNKFYGDLQCPKATQELSNLQIIDISTNNFNGDISRLTFSKWKGMRSANDIKGSQHNTLGFDFFLYYEFYYQAAVIVNLKGTKMELTKILLVFTFIDFSNNKFHGEIPYSIGDLESLYCLNLSHNKLTGSIPTSIGNLTQLCSLDLSVNRLTGKIPVELASLTFIGFLNLSYNRLFGKIPEGRQLQTFPAASFEGNVGLYGCPLDKSCNKKGSGGSSQVLQNGEVHSKKEINWDYVSAALGFAVGFGSTIWLLLHCKRWREIYFGKVDQILVNLVRKC